VARRSRSSFQPQWLIAGGIALVAIFAGLSYLLNQASDPFRTVPPLTVATYLENSNSLRGNTYRVQGEVLNVLGYSASEGRLISVGVDATEDIVPVLIPSELGHRDIEKGQKFIFLLDVTDQGILRAKDLTKA